jgi:hypothetical protein
VVAPPVEKLAAHAVELPSGFEAELIVGNCGDAAAIAVIFHVGAHHDPPGASGMSQVVERVLRRVASEKPGKRIVSSGSELTLYAVATSPKQLLGELTNSSHRGGSADVRDEDSSGSEQGTLHLRGTAAFHLILRARTRSRTPPKAPSTA